MFDKLLDGFAEVTGCDRVALSALVERTTVECATVENTSVDRTTVDRSAVGQVGWLGGMAAAERLGRIAAAERLAAAAQAFAAA